MSTNKDFLNDLLSGVSVDPMMDHLVNFGRWQKLAGSTDEANSLKYVRSTLDGYGLETTLLHHDAFLSLPLDASLDVAGDLVTAITHSMAMPTPEAGLSRRVIDLGSGSKAEFDAANLTDHIVLVDGMATPEMAKRSRLAGAAGQIHISPHEHLHEMCLSPIWGNPGSETMGELPTTSVITISLEDGRALRARLATTPDLKVTIHAKVDTGWRKTPILVADLRAENAPDGAPFILFSGHHDTWYEGVMDNGSANATMLEVARTLAPQRHRMRRHLRLCFWSGHSQGRYSGSAWYADQNWHELERDCAVHVNVDSTGGQGNTLLTQAPAASELSGLAHDVIFTHSGQNHSGVRMARNSDQSFWGIGVPSLFGILSSQTAETPGVRNALGWWWHTPHDKIERIDPALLLRDTRIYTEALGRLLCDDFLPLDISAQAADLVSILEEIALPSDSDVPLAALLADADSLKRALSAFQQDIPANSQAGLKRDRTLMRVSRELVPLDYTCGDRHQHDPALPLAKWPSLDPLRALALEKPGSNAFLLRQGPAVHSANRLLAGLRRARAHLDNEGTDG